MLWHWATLAVTSEVFPSVRDHENLGAIFCNNNRSILTSEKEALGLGLQETVSAETFGAIFCNNWPVPQKAFLLGVL